MKAAADALLPLGFTDLEAAAYVFLLRSGSASGYRVAQGIAKPVANTYKALATLQAKSAVWVEETESRLFRAVPAGELLERFESDCSRRLHQATEALDGVEQPEPPDEQIYRLGSAAQVYDRCRAILRGAKRIVLVDAFPLPLAELRNDIAACAKRGVRVAVQVYEPAAIARAEVVVNFRAAAVRKRWREQWIDIVADSAQYVVALLSADGSGVGHATWSTNAFLAHTFLSGLLAEIFSSAIHDAVARGASRAELQRIAARHRALAGVATAKREKKLTSLPKK